MRLRLTSWRTTLATITLGLLVAMTTLPTAGQSTGEAGLELDVSPSFLLRDRDGARVRATVTLAGPADLRVRVTDPDGRTVRKLFRGLRPAGTLARSWDGRDTRGEIVLDGAYRIVADIASPASSAVADSGLQLAEAWVTVADRRVYSPHPGFITIAIDPGHGGSLDGAVGRDGTREADLNLDIGLRLARMLEGAGVGVALTRSSDRNVNEPPLDLTEDGVIDETDELAARPDIANRARADLFVAIHNNSAVNESVGGPSTFYVSERTFGQRSARLARAIQAELVAALDGIRAGAWQPYDHGALEYPYYVLRDFDPPRLLRPTQMPGVLSEGLFLSNPRELRLLRQPRVRQALAAAYYRAIAEYLAARGDHVGYAPVSTPLEAMAGETVTFEIEVRNQGTRPMRGWRLAAYAVPAPADYVARLGAGAPVGERRIPPLGPGQKVRLRVKVAAPVRGQSWMLLFDARDETGRRASRLGSPPLHVPFTTLEPGSVLPSSAPTGPASGPITLAPTRWPTADRAREPIVGTEVRSWS